MIVAAGSPPPQRDQLGACTLDAKTTFEGRCASRCCVLNSRSSSAESRKDPWHDASRRFKAAWMTEQLTITKEIKIVCCPTLSQLANARPSHSPADSSRGQLRGSWVRRPTRAHPRRPRTTAIEEPEERGAKRQKNGA